MVVLRPQDRERLQERLAKELQGPVRIVHFTQQPSALVIPGRPPDRGQYREARQVLEELATLSPQIALEVHNLKQEPEIAAQHGVSLAPATRILGKAEPAFTFLGAATGYEFGTLVDILIRTSRGESGLSPALAAEIAGVTRGFTVDVSVTPT